MDITLEEVFKMPLNAMKICRVHPDIPKDLKWFLSYFVVNGVYFLYFLVLTNNIIYYNLADKDYAQTCKNGIFVVMFMSVNFKYLFLIYKKNLLISLFEIVKSDYIKMKDLSTKDQEIVLRYAKKSKSYGKLWLMMAVGGVSVFPIKNFILHVYYYCIREYRWIHLYDLIFPKILNDRKDHVVPFCTLYFLMIFYSSYAALVYCSFSPLGPNFMLHACGNLEILTNRVDKIFSEERSAEDVIAELKSIAMELQNIYEFVENIRESFRIAYEIILMLTSIILPATIYEIIQSFSDGDISVEFLVYVIGAILISSSPCYYSELLMEKGEMFRMAVYSCGWERFWDRRTRVMIMLLLQRARRPVAIRTIFKILCLDTLTNVYRLSYTIFNLMNAMWV